MEPTRTTVVNINVHDYDVYVGRTGKGFDGKFGNPSELRGAKDDCRRRVAAVKDFLYYFRHRMGLVWNDKWSKAGIPSRDKEWISAVSALRGKRLGCFCAPALCHSEVFAAWLDGGPIGLAKLEERIKKLEALSG